MTRSQAESNLKSLGIEEPTKEQIDAYLNSIGAEINGIKDKEGKAQEIINSLNEKYKAASSELEQLKTANMTEAEKVQQELESYKALLAERDKTIKASRQKAELAKIGITDEYSDKFFNADGDVDFDNLGKYISKVKDESAKAKELEIANKAGKPLSGAGNPDGGLSPQEKIAKNYADNRPLVSKGASGALAHFKP